MEIRVTNKDIYILDQSLDKNKRKKAVYELLNSKIKLDDLEITVEDYFKINWEKHKTKVCLDLIGYYLSKSPEMKHKHDKEIISLNKDRQMRNGSSNYVNFSNLPKRKQIELGIKDYEDDLGEFEN